MAKWLDPVFDRTQADVELAISKIAEWKKNGSTNVYELKGCLNVSDINRIEGNIQYLSNELSKLYYFPYTTSKSWDKVGLPTIVDITRIIGNIKKIINAYCQPSNSPTLPDTMLNYEQVNSIEENLYLIKAMLDNMVLSFRECGTFNCGEE